MLSCKQATELMSASLDIELSLFQKISLKFHLLMCELCSRCWQQLLFIRNAAHTYSERAEELDYMQDHSLSLEACERIKNALRWEIKE